MKPLGRKYFKSNGSKHNVKVNGKTLCWWLGVCEPNKKAEKEAARVDINRSIKDE